MRSMLRALVLLSLASAPLLGADPKIDAVRIEKDAVYATVNGRALHVDLYVPQFKGPAKPPLVVWIHGGGWVGGNKANPPLMFMVNQGFALASVEYRFSNVAIYPAQIHDCKAAIRFLRASADKYGYDPKRIGAVGASAGGHLVALLGVGHGEKALEGDEGDCLDQSSDVQAVCDALGPTDLLHYEDCLLKAAADDLINKLLGGMPAQKPDLAKLASPLYFVDPTDPPFLIIHGRIDPLVPVSQAQRLHDALRRAGVKSDLLIDPLGGHGNHIFDDGSAFKRITQFFDENLRKDRR